jgi:hypothetical protein
MESQDGCAPHAVGTRRELWQGSSAFPIRSPSMLSPRRTSRGLLAQLVARVLIAALGGPAMGPPESFQPYGGLEAVPGGEALEGAEGDLRHCGRPWR